MKKVHLVKPLLLFSALLLLIGLLYVPNVHAALNDNLTAYYSLNNAVTELFGKTAVTKVTASYNNGGPNGYALTFNGNQHLNLTGWVGPTQPQNVTIGFWLRLTSGFSSGARTFARDTGSNGFMQFDTTNTMRVCLSSGCTTAPTNIQYTSFPVGGWVYVTVTANNTGHALYLNGTLVASGTAAYSVGNVGWMVGSGSSGTGNFVLGNMSDIAIWNRSLSPVEVSQLYNQSGIITQQRPNITSFSISNSLPIVKNDILDLQFVINQSSGANLSWFTTWYYSSDGTTWTNYASNNEQALNQTYATYNGATQHTTATGDLPAGTTTAWQYWKGGLRVFDGTSSTYANTSAVLITNNLPVITDYATNTTNAAPAPVGGSVNFSVTGTDSEADTVALKVCRNNGETWATCTALCTNSPGVVFNTVTPTTVSCAYTPLQTDVRNNTAYILINDTGNVSTATTINYYVNHLPALGNFSYADTSGDTTLLFGETLGFVQVDSSDFDAAMVPNVTITDPDGVVKVSNVAMNAVTGNTYQYPNNIYIDAIGNWNVSFQAVDSDGAVVTYSQTITVSKISLTNTGRVYGYDYQGIPTFASVQNNATLYGYSLAEIRVNSSSNWSGQVIPLLYLMKNNSMSVDVTWYDDLANQTASLNYIKANFKDLIGANILTAVRDVKVYIASGVNVSNQSSLIINNITKQIFQNTSNSFPMFIRNYNQSLIDSNYALLSNSVVYVTAADGNSYINTEMSIMRNTTSLSRVYYALDATTKNYATTFQNNVITKLRSPINLSNTYAPFIAKLNNGDIIVANNQSNERTFNISPVNITQPNAYDLTFKKMLTGKPSTTIVLNVSGFSANVVYFTNLSKIQIAESGTKQLYGYTPYTLANNRDYSLYNANAYLMGSSSANPDDGRIIFTDPSYNQPDFYVWYGVAGSEQVRNWSIYSKVVIAAQNWSQVANKVWASNLSNITQTFGYISVNTYGSYNNPVGCTPSVTCTTWNRSKWLIDEYALAESWTNISANMNVFIDGLDYGVVNDDGQFGDALKQVVNYVRLTKQRKAILNTYTSYADYATLADYTMRESVCGRWDGTTTAPTYSYEDINLETARAAFQKLHGTTVLAESFGNITDYYKAYYCYMQSKVLYGDWMLFSYNQPRFEYTGASDAYGWNYFKYPNLGPALEDSYNVSGDVYTRRFERGIVSVNVTNHTVSWINNQQITNLNFCGYYYDNDDGATDEGEMHFVVNRDLLNRYWSVTDTDLTAFVKTYKCVNVTPNRFYDPSGFYELQFYYVDGDGNMLNNNGLYMYNGANSYDGISWWDNQLNNHPIQPQSQYQYNYYGTTNWALNFTLSRTFDASAIDDVSSTVNRTESGAEKVSVVFRSDADWSIPIYDKTVFLNKTRFNGLYVNNTLLNVTNDALCNTTTPNYASTVVNGDTWQACMFNDTVQGYYSRVVVPHLSTMTYTLDGNTPPVLNSSSIQLIDLSNGTQTWNISWSATDADANNMTTCRLTNGNTTDFTTTVSGQCSILEVLPLNTSIQTVFLSIFDSYNTQSNIWNYTLAQTVYDKIEADPSRVSNTTIQFFKKNWYVSQSNGDFSNINYSFDGLPGIVANVTNGTNRFGLNYNASLITVGVLDYVPSGSNSYTVDSGITFVNTFNITGSLDTSEAVPELNISVGLPQYTSGTQAVNYVCAGFTTYSNFTSGSPLTVRVHPTANASKECYQYTYLGIPIYSDATLASSDAGSTRSYRFENSNGSAYGYGIRFYFPALGTSNLNLNIPYSTLTEWTSKTTSAQQVYHEYQNVYTKETITTDYAYTDISASSLVRVAWTASAAPVNAFFVNLTYTVPISTPPSGGGSTGGGGGGGGATTVTQSTTGAFVVAPANITETFTPGSSVREEFRITNADTIAHDFTVSVVDSDNNMSASKWLTFDTGLRTLAVNIGSAGSLAGDTTYVRYYVKVPENTAYGTYIASIAVTVNGEVKYHTITVTVTKDVLTLTKSFLFKDLYTVGAFCGKDFVPLFSTVQTTDTTVSDAGFCSNGDTPLKIAITPFILIALLGVGFVFVFFAFRQPKPKKRFA